MYVHGVICIRSYTTARCIWGAFHLLFNGIFNSLLFMDGPWIWTKVWGILWLVTLKAAFGLDGQLLGVVGIDVYIDELGNIAQLVRDALENQTNQGNIQPAIVTLNNLNCSLAVSTIDYTLAL